MFSTRNFEQFDINAYQFFWRTFVTPSNLKMALKCLRLAGSYLKKLRWKGRGGRWNRILVAVKIPYVLRVCFEVSQMISSQPRIGSSFYPTVSLAYLD